MVLIVACSKDLGNYEYQEINELDISGVDESYSVRSGVDTLRIMPDLSATMDNSDESRYEYFWILKKDNLVADTIGRERDLVYPVRLDILEYSLFYRVLDKITGVTWTANSKVKVNTAYSRGLLIMGEDEEGFAEAEMLSMMNDTVHVPAILSSTDLPRLKDPVGLVHTGGSYYPRLWAMTRSGSYYLDRASMSSSPNNILANSLFSSEEIATETLHPVVIAPQIAAANGKLGGSSLNRALITVGGDLFASIPLFMADDFYNNPVNRLASAPERRIPAAPYILYPINGMNSIIWYDKKDHRFLTFTGIGISTTSSVLSDKEGDIFPWSQPIGRQLVYAENTRNTDGNSTNGNSYAIMRDADNTHRIYKFYVNGTNSAKRNAYIVSSIATDFDKADFYAFSSNRSVVFYAAGNRLYAYDFNPGFEKIYSFPQIKDQITMLKFDTQIDHVTNSLYIATYNMVTKGTLSRYRVGNNPNLVEINLEPNSSWSGLVKVKDINWRAVD